MDFVSVPVGFHLKVCDKYSGAVVWGVEMLRVSLATGAFAEMVVILKC